MSSNNQKKMSRRDLLKLAGAGSAGLVLSGLPVRVIAQDTITLRIQTATGTDEQIGPVGDLFKEANPNIEIEWMNISGIDHDERAARILALVAAGEPIDSIWSATETSELYAAFELAASVDDRILGDPDQAFWEDFFSDVHPSLVEAWMYEGSLYAPPRDFNAANMYINMDIMREAGFDLPPPDWTVEDFLEIARATTKKNASGVTEQFGYGWTNRLWGSWMPWIFVNGGNLYTEERAPGGEQYWDRYYEGDPAVEGRGGGFRWREPIGNSPEVVEALQLVVDLWEEGVSPDLELGTGETLTGFYATGVLNMFPAGGFLAGRLIGEGMEPGSFDAQLWPAWKNQKHQFGTGGHMLASQAPHADETWEFIKLEISREGFAVSGWFNPIITTPTRRSLSGAEGFADFGLSNYEIFYGTLDDHPDTAPIPAPPWSNPMTNIFTRFTGLAMSGQMGAQEAMDEMQRELEDLTARQPKYYGDD